jgi:hypothetical protein
MTTTQKISALKQVCDMVLDVVKSAGKQGAPASEIFAALSAFGCTHDQFEMLVNILVEAGKIRRRNHTLHTI